MIQFLDNSSPAMMQFIVANNLLQKHYMQCFKCYFVEIGYKMSEINRPCPNCNDKDVCGSFPQKIELQPVYADIVQSFFEYDQKYQDNKNLVVEWIQKEIKTDKQFANELFEQSSKLDMYKFVDKYQKQLSMEKIDGMNFFHTIYREKNIPKIQMFHIVIHSMTLLEMYLSYIIQSILMRTQTNLEIVIHIVESNRNWNDYFKTIRKISKIRWKEHISPRLFKDLSTNFEQMRQIRNNLVHRSSFLDNFQVVKDSVTMASRLLPVFAGLHNEFLLGDVEGGYEKIYI